ncbi:acylphosphatase [Roseivivax lentus]|uniref:Acylphosphatase n=1 Tax=Roseivivax lentus TaxID=633194 RepID=A0A1N7KV01_9RHOB|nr:acylphosphatase [Roseivivax lentus]SIS65423.1 acylphosphatase [Roseivivax lentus]
MSETPTTRRFTIEGRVQGVGFRAWTQGRAEALGLRGWVRNLPDGRVEAVLGGAEDAVDAMARALGQGPVAAAVTGVTVAPAEEVLPRGVEIRR